jgi:protoporphyrin/coproporphyrin ferrochelatase
MSAASPMKQPRLDPTRKTGLILCGMGGPDGPEAVEPFLRNLFRDPCILPVPRLLTPALSWLVAKRRAPFVRKRYAMISPDSATPQLQTTRDQGVELALRMGQAGCTTVDGVAMRYWHPFPEETVGELLAMGAEQFLVVPAYPQYACATTGSTLKFVQEGITALAPDAAVYLVNDWHLLPGYVQAVADPAIAALSAWVSEGLDPRECALVYVAHSLPEKFIDQGDPYFDQVTATVQAAHKIIESTLASREEQHFLAGLPHPGDEPGPLLTFQSKVGPIKWLGPEITDEVQRLATAGCRRLFVQPVSFTCEHVETLHELDIELKADTAAMGVEDFARGDALNLNSGWLDSLAAELLLSAFAPEVEAHV